MVDRKEIDETVATNDLINFLVQQSEIKTQRLFTSTGQIIYNLEPTLRYLRYSKIKSLNTEVEKMFIEALGQYLCSIDHFKDFENMNENVLNKLVIEYIENYEKDKNFETPNEYKSDKDPSESEDPQSRNIYVNYWRDLGNSETREAITQLFNDDEKLYYKLWKVYRTELSDIGLQFDLGKSEQGRKLFLRENIKNIDILLLVKVFYYVGCFFKS